MKNNDKITNRIKRKHRIRARQANTDLPRLVVYRSLRHISAQLIDEISGKTLMGVSSMQLKEKRGTIATAAKIGQTLGKLASKAGIKKIKFDRRGYKYHGQVKALAEAARAAGLIF